MRADRRTDRHANLNTSHTSLEWSKHHSDVCQRWHLYFYDFTSRVDKLVVALFPQDLSCCIFFVAYLTFSLTWWMSCACTEQLDVPTCRRSTIGDRAFPVVGAKVWNSLPSDVTSASSLPVFKNRLKTYLFRRCYETVWLWITFLFPSHYLPSKTVVLAIVFTV